MHPIYLGESQLMPVFLGLITDNAPSKSSKCPSLIDYIVTPELKNPALMFRLQSPSWKTL